MLNVEGLTPAAAARVYNRVLAQRDLNNQADDIAGPATRFVNDQGPSVGTPGAPVQVADPIADEPKIDYGGHNYAGGMPPPKPRPEVPAQTTPPPAVTQPQQSTTPPPPTGAQTGEIPAESSPTPVQPSDPKSTSPLFDRPDISGKKEGDRWTEIRDGFTHTYTIPVGNGNKSVDHEISRDGVLIGTSRVAYGENGGAQQWVDVVGSASLYAEQESSASNQYTQVFNAGTSTAGNPDSIFGTLPDLATTFPLVENGVVVGSLQSVEIPGSGPGLYGNKYVDHHGNVSIWRTGESEHGPLITNQIGNVDSRGYGWYTPSPAYGRRWEIAPKPDGTSILTNIETTSQGQHFTVWDPAANTRTERFHSSTPGVSGYLLSQHADGTRSIEGDDGSRLVVDDLGRIVSSQPATVRPAPEQSPKQPDIKSNWQKFTQFADDIRTGFGLAYDDTKRGIAGLLGQNGSLKEAWLGLATSGVGIGIGLAITAIDVGEIAIGRGSWSRLGNDVLGTGNELSIFAIGADWTQFDKEPGETIGRALFGTMLLFGPKVLNNAAGKLPPPAAVSTAINNATTAFGRSGLSLGAPALAATNGISFPGAARTVGPASFASDTGRASAGSGLPRASGSGPNTAAPATPTRHNSNAAPLLPAEAANAGARHTADQPTTEPREHSDLTDSRNAAGSRRSQSMDSSPLISGGSPWELHLGVSVEQLRQMAPERINEFQVRRANVDPGYHANFYNSLGYRKSLYASDDTGLVPPQIKQNSSGKWIAASDVPEPTRPRYRDDEDVDMRFSRLKDVDNPMGDLSPSERATLNGFALVRMESIRAVPGSKDAPGYVAAQDRMTKTAERYGDEVLRRHAVPINFPHAKHIELHGPSNGKDRFDRLWYDLSSDFYIVGEAKSQVSTGLGSRTLPTGEKVSQGTLGYFLDILRMMDSRGSTWKSEAWLAGELRKALKEERVWYGVVYGRPGIGGVHDGYKMRRFDIRE
ncbi:hypothetical protein [Nocardia asteroides]|uniref:hypothetical protein n=1 Tax=Nocardia asteroides TaxID=1824 RepID=UPI001E5E9ADA|nr:hypothetical protein [Nocardia asteroides]UGT52385.1 hypothetical protein LTT85_16705 [Nocardia asteroides]